MSSHTPPALPLPLPRVSGPKLEPYGGTASADIDFIRYIGDVEDADSKVWKVSIDGHFYALKIFPFEHWEWLQEVSGGWARPSNRPTEGYTELTPKEYVDYLEPFSCECRAYGRLKQEGREDIAVRAYGYVLLTPDQERRVTETSGVNYEDVRAPGSEAKDLDGNNPWGRLEWHRYEPLRAIVKEFMSEETTDFVSAQVPQMYDDVETLHSLGILIRDIHPGNYLDGKLIDFSRSWTMRHPCLERAADESFSELRQEELREFLTMLEAWANNNDPDLEIPERLVPRFEKPFGEDNLGVDPRDYDWRKWERGEDGDRIERNA